MIRIRHVHNSEDVVIKRDGRTVYRGRPNSLGKNFSRQEHRKIQRYLNRDNKIDNETLDEITQEIIETENEEETNEEVH